MTVASLVWASTLRAETAPPPVAPPPLGQRVPEPAPPPVISEPPPPPPQGQPVASPAPREEPSALQTEMEGDPVTFWSSGHRSGFELYDARSATRLSPPVVRCPADCTALVPPGRYVVVVTPEEGRRIGRRSVSLEGPSLVQVEAAAESSRWVGIGAIGVGIPLVLGGLGLALGASQFDGGPDPPRPELFWLGVGSAAVGIASTVAGFTLLAGKPHVLVDEARSTAAPTRNVDYSAPPPIDRDETSRPPRAPSVQPEWPAASRARAGRFRVEERPNQALVFSGALTFAVGFGVGAAVAGYDIGNGERRGYSVLAIPLVGAFLPKDDKEDWQGIAFWSGLPQLVGLTLVLLGATSTLDVRVRDWRQSGWSVTPITAPGFAGLTLGGKL